jgi:hypothetical protein
MLVSTIPSQHSAKGPKNLQGCRLGMVMTRLNVKVALLYPASLPGSWGPAVLDRPAAGVQFTQKCNSHAAHKLIKHVFRSLALTHTHRPEARAVHMWTTQQSQHMMQESLDPQSITSCQQRCAALNKDGKMYPSAYHCSHSVCWLQSIMACCCSTWLTLLDIACGPGTW